MKYYRLWPYRPKNHMRVKLWDVQVQGWFGWRTLNSYTEWRDAKDRLKVLAQNNRPACVRTYKANCEEDFHWDTKAY